MIVSENLLEKQHALIVKQTEAILTMDSEIQRLCESVARIAKERDELNVKLRDARNELCEKCGLYHNAHEGACNGCKWNEEG